MTQATSQTIRQPLVSTLSPGWRLFIATMITALAVAAITFSVTSLANHFGINIRFPGLFSPCLIAGSGLVALAIAGVMYHQMASKPHSGWKIFTATVITALAVAAITYASICLAKHFGVDLFLPGVIAPSALAGGGLIALIIATTISCKKTPLPRVPEPISKPKPAVPPKKPLQQPKPIARASFADMHNALRP